MKCSCSCMHPSSYNISTHGTCAYTIEFLFALITCPCPAAATTLDVLSIDLLAQHLVSPYHHIWMDGIWSSLVLAVLSPYSNTERLNTCVQAHAYLDSALIKTLPALAWCISGEQRSLASVSDGPLICVICRGRQTRVFYPPCCQPRQGRSEHHRQLNHRNLNLLMSQGEADSSHRICSTCSACCSSRMCDREYRCRDHCSASQTRLKEPPSSGAVHAHSCLLCL